MADFTMCSGKGSNGKDCRFKNYCYRHVAPRNEFYQSEFTEPPYTEVIGSNGQISWSCSHFKEIPLPNIKPNTDIPLKK